MGEFLIRDNMNMCVNNKVSPLFRVTSLVTLCAFLFNTAFVDMSFAKSRGAINRAPTVETLMVKTLTPATFQLPENLGTVRDAWENTGQSSRFKGQASGEIIIHIQDAHCNYYCQKKISEIIEHLNKEYGISSVNLEGGAKEYDLSPFTDIGDKNKREKVSDYFVNQGLVNGAEYFAVNNPGRVALWGMEDAKAYIDNLKVYRDSLAYKSQVDGYLRSLSTALSSLKVKMYPEDLRALDAKYGQYKAGNLGLKDYLIYLVELSGKKNTDMAPFRNIVLLKEMLNDEAGIDFKLADKDRDELVSLLESRASAAKLKELVDKTVDFKQERISQAEFYRFLFGIADWMNIDTGAFAALKRYQAYVEKYERIDKTAVMDELSKLEDVVKEKLFTNDDERRLDKLSKNLALMKNMFNISFTKDDYKYYLANETSFDAGNYVEFIEKNIPNTVGATPAGVNGRSPLPGDIANLDTHRRDMARFYEYSLVRDEAFVRNLKVKSPRPAMYDFRGGQKAELNANDDTNVAVIVTGGFHTENLCDLFKKRGISYISIMPNFKACDGYESPYFKVLSGQNTWDFRSAVHDAAKNMLAPPDQMSVGLMEAMRGGAGKNIVDGGQGNSAVISFVHPGSDDTVLPEKILDKEQNLPAAIKFLQEAGGRNYYLKTGYVGPQGIITTDDFNARVKAVVESDIPMQVKTFLRDKFDNIQIVFEGDKYDSSKPVAFIKSVIVYGSYLYGGGRYYKGDLDLRVVIDWGLSEVGQEIEDRVRSDQYRSIGYHNAENMKLASDSKVLTDPMRQAVRGADITISSYEVITKETPADERDAADRAQYALCGILLYGEDCFKKYAPAVLDQKSEMNIMNIVKLNLLESGAKAMKNWERFGLNPEGKMHREIALKRYMEMLTILSFLAGQNMAKVLPRSVKAYYDGFGDIGQALKDVNGRIENLKGEIKKRWQGRTAVPATMRGIFGTGKLTEYKTDLLAAGRIASSVMDGARDGTLSIDGVSIYFSTFKDDMDTSLIGALTVQIGDSFISISIDNAAQRLVTFSEKGKRITVNGKRLFELMGPLMLDVAIKDKKEFLGGFVAHELAEALALQAGMTGNDAHVTGLMAEGYMTQSSRAVRRALRKLRIMREADSNLSFAIEQYRIEMNRGYPALKTQQIKNMAVITEPEKQMLAAYKKLMDAIAKWYKAVRKEKGIFVYPLRGADILPMVSGLPVTSIEKDWVDGIIGIEAVKQALGLREEEINTLLYTYDKNGSVMRNDFITPTTLDAKEPRNYEQPNTLGGTLILKGFTHFLRHYRSGYKDEEICRLLEKVLVNFNTILVLDNEDMLFLTKYKSILGQAFKMSGPSMGPIANGQAIDVTCSTKDNTSQKKLLIPNVFAMFERTGTEYQGKTALIQPLAGAANTAVKQIENGNIDYIIMSRPKATFKPRPYKDFAKEKYVRGDSENTRLSNCEYEENLSVEDYKANVSVKLENIAKEINALPVLPDGVTKQGAPRVFFYVPQDNGRFSPHKVVTDILEKQFADIKGLVVVMKENRRDDLSLAGQYVDIAKNVNNYERVRDRSGIERTVAGVIGILRCVVPECGEAGSKEELDRLLDRLKRGELFLDMIKAKDLSELKDMNEAYMAMRTAA